VDVQGYLSVIDSQEPARSHTLRLGVRRYNCVESLEEACSAGRSEEGVGKDWIVAGGLSGETSHRIVEVQNL